MTRHRDVGTGHMEVFDAELWAIGFVNWERLNRNERLQDQGLKTVAAICASEAVIRQTAHRDAGSGQRLARRMN